MVKTLLLYVFLVKFVRTSLPSKMFGIVKKIRNGRTVYYFELFIRTPQGRKGISRYLGNLLPGKDILLKNLFHYYEDFSKLIITETSEKIKNYFKYTGINSIESCRFYYQALKNKLNFPLSRHFQLIFLILFILNSARAEGSRMIKQDIEHSILKKKPKSLEHKEAINILNAVRWAFSNQFTWSTISIRKLHFMIFHDIEPALAGRYKESDNVVGEQVYGELISTTPFEKIPEEMKKWVEEIKNNKAKVYPPILALETHLKFESMHPFHDGNGRIGRILLNRILIEGGFMPVIFFEENHKAYCSSIAQAREGRKDKYIKLFVKQMEKTRETFENEKNNKEFISERKNLSISWGYDRERTLLRFKARA